MKHLYKFESLDSDVFNNQDEYQIQLIKDIILELKHEFPSIEGIISLEKKGDYTYTVISLSPLPIYNESCKKLIDIEKRIYYISTVVEVSKRIWDATGRETRIVDLLEDTITSGNTIDIWVDDPKNKDKAPKYW